ncbi:MAG: tRNA pseudouridine(38-40) synthase TruA [Betaproteobacteria bacterium]|nr:tRNA pseudouridine(38-40) synthase TruA [Betaproteobacteria bacterium]
MRIALGLEYDGSAFYGWQTQPGGQTVQDTLEAAISSIAAEPLRVVCAGRTDTGVHATAQVVHFDTGAARPPEAWVRGVNALLPPTVAVRWMREVPQEFHARFSARARHYRYLLLNRPQRPGLWHGRAGWFHRPLDLAAMQEAAALLEGEHDFSAFRAAQCQARSPCKHLYRAEVRREADFLIFDFAANAFLHHMVRNMVGSLVYVGKGKYPPAWIAELLSAANRNLAAPTFAPDGLYLSGVEYEPHWGFPGMEERALFQHHFADAGKPIIG